MLKFESEPAGACWKILEKAGKTARPAFRNGESGHALEPR
jgi:hypothetical protein